VQKKNFNFIKKSLLNQNNSLPLQSQILGCLGDIYKYLSDFGKWVQAEGL